MTFAVFMLLCGAIGQVAGDDEAVDSIDPDSDDSFPTSEDVPLWQFEATVVTIGKASGKEKKKEVPAFFLRGDDAPQAATRFVYLNSLPMNHLPHFTSVFSHEWTHNVPDDVKPRERAHKRRAKALGPKSYWKRGVELGDDGAMLALGRLYYHGNGVKKDPKKANQLYGMAADRGHPHAQHLYAVVCDDLTRSEQLRYVKLAADQGLTGAEYKVGKNYEDVEADFEEAKRWYARAAAKGDEKAIEVLASDKFRAP